LFIYLDFIRDSDLTCRMVWYTIYKKLTQRKIMTNTDLNVYISLAITLSIIVGIISHYFSE
jgi:hypothetical protein